ncbi:hypothetical protein [Methylobacterium sp. WCS2018Hpa-22]|uniref:hypothetical protein n=1 Tax=Methylobacterium sp. WCS2018Hpa-22 TaxID=3073633 RepID=UPI002889D997|nr:hypothetical protein [Methylobacterium sp. WCS2018Hpa-22]
MSRRAWFVWRQTSTGQSGALYFDNLPGPDGLAYGPKILVTHELRGLDLADVLAKRLGLSELARRFPAPHEAPQAEGSRS